LRRKLSLHGLEQIPTEDRGVVAAIDFSAVHHLPDVKAVLEQIRQCSDAERAAANAAAGRESSGLTPDASAVEVGGERPDRAKRKIPFEDGAHRLGLGRDHHDLLVHGRIAERDRTADLEAAILSRTRSPISSRSNWANDSSTLSVSRPMLELVLKDCVTDTNETPWSSNSSMSLAKSVIRR
jgi:hypothetical protein